MEAVYCSIRCNGGAGNTALYAANNEDTGFDFYPIMVDSNGAPLNHDYFGTFSSFGNTIHFDAGTGLVYSDDGHIVDPSNGSQAGFFSFPGFGRMVADSTLGRACFVGTDSRTANLAISAFDLTHFTLLGTIQLPGLNSNNGVGSFVRWGPSGLAFNTFIFGGGPEQVVLVTSPLIRPMSPNSNRCLPSCR